MLVIYVERNAIPRVSAYHNHTQVCERACVCVWMIFFIFRFLKQLKSSDSMLRWRTSNRQAIQRFIIIMKLDIASLSDHCIAIDPIARTIPCSVLRWNSDDFSRPFFAQRSCHVHGAANWPLRARDAARSSQFICYVLMDVYESLAIKLINQRSPKWRSLSAFHILARFRSALMRCAVNVLNSCGQHVDGCYILLGIINFIVRCNHFVHRCETETSVFSWLHVQSSVMVYCFVLMVVNDAP